MNLDEILQASGINTSALLSQVKEFGTNVGAAVGQSIGEAAASQAGQVVGQNVGIGAANALKPYLRYIPALIVGVILIYLFFSAPKKRR